MKHKFAVSLVASLVLGANAMADTVYLTVNSHVYEVNLIDNEFARDLKDLLPVTLSFRNFGANERIADLDKRIGPSSYKQTYEVKRGDLAYYVPWGNLCVFRVSYHSPDDLAPLGSMSEEAIKAVESAGTGVLSADRPD